MPVKPEYVPAGAAGGLTPPAGAPREVAQPLTDEAVAQMVERAAANEQALQPLAFTSSPVPVRPLITHEPPPVSEVDALTGGTARRIRQVKRDRSHAEAEQQTLGRVSSAERVREPTVSDISAGAVDAPKGDPNLVPPLLPHQKAGSNTDSPSRGVPHDIATPGKRITGGFGEAADAQYLPLNGMELRELVNDLLDRLHARIQDDLRFSMAVCYPRVAVRVELIVDAFPEDAGFTIPVTSPPHEKTPLEIARAHADEVVFVLKAERVEMTKDGESVAPPNLIRQELGLSVPRKQAIQTPTGRQFVDVVVP